MYQTKCLIGVKKRNENAKKQANIQSDAATIIYDRVWFDGI